MYRKLRSAALGLGQHIDVRCVGPYAWHAIRISNVGTNTDDVVGCIGTSEATDSRSRRRRSSTQRTEAVDLIDIECFSCIRERTAALCYQEAGSTFTVIQEASRKFVRLT